MSQRPGLSAWRVLAVLALVVGLAAAFKLVWRTLPKALASLTLLEQEWPEVVAHDSHFEFADTTRQEARFDLPIGWRVVLDPEERLTNEDLLPHTVVIQQGRFLFVNKPGQRMQPKWSVMRSRQVKVTGASFRKLRLLIWIGVALLVFFGFVVSLFGLTLLAGIASGILLLAEFFGILKAPEMPFAAAALAVVPVVLLAVALWTVGLLGLTSLRILAVVAVLWVVGLVLLLPRDEDAEL